VHVRNNVTESKNEFLNLDRQQQKNLIVSYPKAHLFFSKNPKLLNNPANRQTNQQTNPNEDKTCLADVTIHTGTHTHTQHVCDFYTHRRCGLDWMPRSHHSESLVIAGMVSSYMRDAFLDTRPISNFLIILSLLRWCFILVHSVQAGCPACIQSTASEHLRVKKTTYKVKQKCYLNCKAGGDLVTTHSDR